jgi:nucleotide-binding universal stress UspA family protein
MYDTEERRPDRRPEHTMKFIIATDGSEESNDALTFGANLATAADAEITLVHSVTPEIYTEGTNGPVVGLSEAERKIVLESIEDAEARGERVLEEAAKLVAEFGVDAATELLYGDPAETLPAFAEAEGYDAIVVGHRGMSNRIEGLLGSVAKELAGRSTVPVTIVR